MNFGMFKLTFGRRRKLAIFVTVTNFIQVLLGVIVTGGSIFIVVTVSPKFYSEKAEITFVFTVTGMFGTHIIITYLIGIRIGDKCFNYAHKKSTGRQLQFWMISSLNTTINVLILSVLAGKISKHIIRSLRHSLEKGMHNYLKDPNWKHALDKWQFTLQCCGVNNHEDWHKITWVDKYHLNLDHPLVNEFRLSKEHLHLPIVPWSCCRYDFPMQCFHDPLQQYNSKHLWADQPNLVMDSINTNGCLTTLRHPIENALSIFILATILLILLQIILLLTMRVLFTSCKNSIILGDPDGISPGWIFTRSGFGRKGRTLSQILVDLGVEEHEIARYQAFEEGIIRKSEPSSRTTPKSTPTSTPTKEGRFKVFNRFKNPLKKTASQQTRTSDKSKPSKYNESEDDPVSTEDEEALLLR